MRYVFDFVAANYLRAKTESFRNHSVATFLRHDAADSVKAALDPQMQDLVVTGSPGKGRWSNVPWIGVFDPIVTVSAMRGHFIVYLFSADMNRLYLSLNQGTTAAHEEFGARANAELARRAELLRHRVPEYTEHFTGDGIELGAMGSLPSGYEAGHAFGRLYRLDEFPFNNDPVRDLQLMLELYRKATARGGTDYLGDASITKADSDAEDLTERRRYRFHRRIERNPKIAERVKEMHGYVCQGCDFDFEKQYGELGYAYIEAHHLTPLSDLPEDEAVKRNPREDFAVLCANCHRMIHRKNAPRLIEEFRKFVRIRFI